MLISRTAVHGIYAICYLSRQRSSEVSSSARVAAALGITRAHAAKVLKRLAAAGVVSSVRGRQGGYTLTRKMSEIGVLEVLDSLEPARGKTHLRAEFCRGDEAALCSAHRGLLRLEDLIRDALSYETLDGLAGSICTDDRALGFGSRCCMNGIGESLAALHGCQRRVLRGNEDQPLGSSRA